MKSGKKQPAAAAQEKKEKASASMKITARLARTAWLRGVNIKQRHSGSRHRAIVMKAKKAKSEKGSMAAGGISMKNNALRMARGATKTGK